MHCIVTLFYILDPPKYETVVGHGYQQPPTGSQQPIWMQNIAGPGQTFKAFQGYPQPAGKPLPPQEYLPQDPTRMAHTSVQQCMTLPNQPDITFPPTSIQVIMLINIWITY